MIVLHHRVTNLQVREQSFFGIGESFPRYESKLTMSKPSFSVDEGVSHITLNISHPSHKKMTRHHFTIYISGGKPVYEIQTR